MPMQGLTDVDRVPRPARRMDMSRIEGPGSKVELFLSSSRVDSMCDDASGDAGLGVDSRAFFWEGALRVIDALVEGPGRDRAWG